MKKSIVIRGSISYERRQNSPLDASLEAIRNWFDGEIVLSTWKGQEKFLTEKSKNLIDKFVYSEDPGEIDNHKLKHFKRQVFSYFNGFCESSGDVVLVTRPDILFKKDLFEHIDNYPLFTEELKVFEKKLLVSNMMTIRPDSNEIPNCFRICDWFQVGYRQDIEKWANILDIAMNLDTSKMTEENCTESIWFLSVLKKQFGNIIDIYEPSSEIKQFAWKSIVNNFIVMDMRTSLNSENINWEFLPEYGSCYFSESLYKELYKSL